MRMIDRIEIDDKAIVRKTKEGYLVAQPRVARTGIQLYRGDEVGKPDMPIVRVYRADSEVFNRDSMGTFAHRPITDDHPVEAVNAENWADHAIGTMGDEIVRDGEFVRVGTLIMDAAAIAKIDAGKAELSVGYDADLVWEAGESPDGLHFDAFQRNIRVNHLALVGVARGGHKLRIGDETKMTTKTILVDGIPVEVTDAAATVIDKLIGERNAARTDLTAKDTKIGELAASITAKDGEIATLKADAEKNKITPAMIDERVKATVAVATDARKIMGDEFKTDGKEPEAIRAEVVNAKMGDAAKGFSVDAINGAFAMLAKTAADAGVTGAVAIPGARADMRTAIQNADAAKTADKAWEDANKAQSEAWRGKAA